MMLTTFKEVMETYTNVVKYLGKTTFDRKTYSKARDAHFNAQDVLPYVCHTHFDCLETMVNHGAIRQVGVAEVVTEKMEEGCSVFDANGDLIADCVSFPRTYTNKKYLYEINPNFRREVWETIHLIMGE